MLSSNACGLRVVFAVVLVGLEVHSRLRYEFRVNLFTFARGFPG